MINCKDCQAWDEIPPTVSPAPPEPPGWCRRRAPEQGKTLAYPVTPADWGCYEAIRVTAPPAGPYKPPQSRPIDKGDSK